MFEGVRDFVITPAGKGLSGLLILGGICWALVTIRRTIWDTDRLDASNARTFVCSETHKTFAQDLKVGVKYPIKSPYSGRETGYPADETCNWTVDGKIDSEVTYVLMNSTYGQKEPTFCPTCHRLVIRSNPAATPDIKPPPTESEYLLLHQASGQTPDRVPSK